MQNLGLLLREEVVALAERGEWREVVRKAQRHPAPDDAVWLEVVALAYFHLGHQEAQTGNWRGAAGHWRLSNQYKSNRYIAQNLALAEEALENWDAAAEAWREMIRRRPRKADHPDYLDDRQVTAIWEHVADCYTQAEMEAEAVTCLQSALKYSPDNLDIRLKLADIYMDEGRLDAAINEVRRILERDENHLPALTRLATLYQGSWQYDSRPIWRRILAIEPNHVEARQGLTEEYLEKSEWSLQSNNSKRAIQLLEEGLKDIPGSPPLLLALGRVYSHIDKPKKAREYLLQAYQAAPQVVATVGMVVHELLHVDAGDMVESLLPQIRQIPGLQPPFWVDQGEQVLGCELGQEWATRFFDEALVLAEQLMGDDTKAGILLDIYEAAANEDMDELVNEYRQRIRAEVPASGAVEYIEAYEWSHQKHDVKGTRRLLRKAKQQAKRANDQGVLKRAEAMEAVFSRGFPGRLGAPDGLEALQRIFATLMGAEDADDFDDLF
jgi:tetratricopeptide (TPR) repeat protein